MTVRIIKKLFLVSAGLLSLAVHANDFPGGCVVSGFGYNNNYLILNETGEQSFFLIKNSTPASIELKRVETRDVFMSPTLSTILDGTQWAAFASDVQNLHFQCFKKSGDTNMIVDCREYLDVCQYPHVKFALSNMGNYWVSTNKTKADVIKESVAKGIYLKW